MSSRDVVDAAALGEFVCTGAAVAPQQRLYFRPEWQGQGALREWQGTSEIRVAGAGQRPGATGRAGPTGYELGSNRRVGPSPAAETAGATSAVKNWDFRRRYRCKRNPGRYQTCQGLVKGSQPRLRHRVPSRQPHCRAIFIRVGDQPPVITGHKMFGLRATEQISFSTSIYDDDRICAAGFL